MMCTPMSMSGTAPALLLAEDAPVGDAAAAQGAHLDEEDVAELAVFAGLDEGGGGIAVALLEADGELDLVLLGGGDHLLALGRVHGHGLFDHRVAAGVAGVHDGGAVHAVGGANVDGVGLDDLEHLLPVEEEGLAGDAPLLVHHVEALLENVDAGDDLELGNLLVRVQVRLGDAAAPDDGDAELLALVRLLLAFHFGGYALSHFDLPSFFR